MTVTLLSKTIAEMTLIVDNIVKIDRIRKVFDLKRIMLTTFNFYKESYDINIFGFLYFNE